MIAALAKRYGLQLAVVVLIGVLALLVNHYRDNAIAYKGQRDKATEHLTLANATINDMQVRQRDVAALDAKYTKELTDAQASIDQLHSDVVAGRKRLQLNAKCSEGGGAISSSLVNATSPRLTDSAQRDYFTLRQRISTVTGQVNYLQQYIKEQCR